MTPKRSPKRRGPAKKYAPETTDVSHVKKARHIAVPKRGAKATTQASTAITTITLTNVAIPEYPPSSASPLDGRNEMHQISLCFQSLTSRFQEELNRLRLENEHQQKIITSLLFEKKSLMKRLERQNENQIGQETLEKIIALMHNFELQTRGTKIMHAAISATGVLESEVQAHSAYPMSQLEQMAHYSYPQNPQQASESFRGTKDVLLSMPDGLQKRVTMPISSINMHQSFNQPALTPP